MVEKIFQPSDKKFSSLTKILSEDFQYSEWWVRILSDFSADYSDLSAWFSSQIMTKVQKCEDLYTICEDLVKNATRTILLIILAYIILAPYVIFCRYRHWSSLFKNKINLSKSLLKPFKRSLKSEQYSGSCSQLWVELLSPIEELSSDIWSIKIWFKFDLKFAISAMVQKQIFWS